MHVDINDLRVPRRKRGNLRRFAEVQGLVGDFQTPHRDLELLTTDGVRLDATVLDGPPRDDAPAVLLAHGFGAHRRKPSYAYLADVLGRAAHVLTLDLRGHGTSGGASGLGCLEHHDIAAGVRHLRSEGHPRVVVIGVSMAGTAVANALGRDLAEPDAAVLISAPGWILDEPRTKNMAEMHEWWSVPWRRQVVRYIMRTRLIETADWTQPMHPVDAVTEVDLPLLVVHGEDDGYFPVSDGDAIASAAPQGVFWREPHGFGHAEDGFEPGFALALVHAVLTVAEEKRFPARDEARLALRAGATRDGQ